MLVSDQKIDGFVPGASFIDGREFDGDLIKHSTAMSPVEFIVINNRDARETATPPC
jgi:hypothetical protein